MGEKWTLEVEHAMGCNCNWGCPCSYQSPPTYGTCEAALVYRIRDGKYGDVPLNGLCWLTAAAWPGPLHELNGRAVVFIDERADEAQRGALTEIATGRAGGPIGLFMGTVTAGIEVRIAKIKFDANGKNSSFSVESHVKVEFEPIRNPVTGEEHHVSTLLHTGMLNKQEDHYSVRALDVDADGITFSYRGRNAFTSLATWQGP